MLCCEIFHKAEGKMGFNAEYFLLIIQFKKRRRVYHHLG